jgi:hypothetical protein
MLEDLYVPGIYPPDQTIRVETELERHSPSVWLGLDNLARSGSFRRVVPNSARSKFGRLVPALENEQHIRIAHIRAINVYEVELAPVLRLLRVGDGVSVGLLTDNLTLLVHHGPVGDCQPAPSAISGLVADERLFFSRSIHPLLLIESLEFRQCHLLVWTLVLVAPVTTVQCSPTCPK